MILYQESLTNTVIDSATTIKNNLVKKDYTVTLNHPRSDLKYEIADYDLIVFISPIYARHFSKPTETYISDHDFTGKNVLVLLTGQLGDKGECDKAKELFSSVNNLEVVKAKKADSTVLKKLEGLTNE